MSVTKVFIVPTQTEIIAPLCSLSLSKTRKTFVAFSAPMQNGLEEGPILRIAPLCPSSLG